jgi:hypothetical protein
MTSLKPILPDIYVRVLELIKEDQSICECVTCDCESTTNPKTLGYGWCNECHENHGECNMETCQHFWCCP